MKPNEILAALILNNYSQVKIAQKCGVNRSQVCNVIHGRSRSLTVREEIARTIGKPVEEIWPELVA
ncbi:helix-turn-helix domain-containing protein [Sporomusa sphaeroides DSM 2875]|uniref:helix-turn-helix domain-containing protein n=1 Tax=Sporomusa sphaeroides TaxID=47679 RepID=UPI00202F83E5|nr:helix-turn-helix domain-containing protein [Sporomusa sphaeroides]MCM0757376.1 helix-turn-helix domain-containing protein [Sporomusa sphaeroides DSM 2875]